MVVEGRRRLAEELLEYGTGVTFDPAELGLRVRWPHVSGDGRGRHRLPVGRGTPATELAITLQTSWVGGVFPRAETRVRVEMLLLTGSVVVRVGQGVRLGHSPSAGFQADFRLR